MRDESSPEYEVTAIENAITAVKSAQRLGTKSVINYRTRTSSLADYYFRIYQTNPERYFRITVKNDRSKLALMRLMIYARVNNSNVMEDPIPYRTPTAPPVGMFWKREWPTAEGYTSWIVQVYKGQFGIDYYDAYFKFFIEGTDSGTWTITPL